MWTNYCKPSYTTNECLWHFVFAICVTYLHSKLINIQIKIYSILYTIQLMLSKASFLFRRQRSKAVAHRYVCFILYRRLLLVGVISDLPVEEKTLEFLHALLKQTTYLIEIFSNILSYHLQFYEIKILD